MAETLEEVIEAGALPCAGTCPLSTIRHAHFPDGFNAFMSRATAAIRATLPPEPPGPDPAIAHRERWAAAFAAVLAAIPEAQRADPAVIVRAMDLARDLS